MKATIKRRWLKALRSGKYKQGKEVLYDETDDSYCCIGVLCRITERIPKDACSWGMHGWETLEGMSHEQGIKLAEMNDKGRSFKQIANYIEKHL